MMMKKSFSIPLLMLFVDRLVSNLKFEYHQYLAIALDPFLYKCRFKLLIVTLPVIQKRKLFRMFNFMEICDKFFSRWPNIFALSILLSIKAKVSVICIRIKLRVFVIVIENLVMRILRFILHSFRYMQKCRSITSDFHFYSSPK